MIIYRPDGVPFYDTDKGLIVTLPRRYVIAAQAKAQPLAGHAGHCERVTRATVLGTLDGPCTCGAQA